jgi:hypothetical protein
MTRKPSKPRITEFLGVGYDTAGTEFRYFITDTGRITYRYKTKSGWSVEYFTTFEDDDARALIRNLVQTLESISGKPAWMALRDGKAVTA